MPRVSSAGLREKHNWPQIYVSVALTTLATLILELALTRIFSVVFYYHFAFLAISIALFGLGAGGVLSYWFARKGTGAFATLGVLAAVASLSVVGSLIVVLTRTSQDGWTLALIYFASALPFLLAGAIVSIAISETIQRVNKVYFFDLIGAAGGCLLLVPFLNLFGGPNTVLAAAVLFAASSAMWFNLAGRPSGRAAAVALSLLLVMLIAVNAKQSLIDVRFAKGQALEREKFVKWNSFSRIALAPEKGSDAMMIFIDADASTGIANFDFERLTAAQRRDLIQQGPGLPYRIRPGAKTLIIGPGGGWDVARAIASGSRDVTGVEINPIIAETIMQRRFPDLSRHLYARPDVRMFVEDGRAFIRRSPEKYQVIQATLVDTWASTAAGAFALSENNLYTTEAFEDYFSRLTGDGILAFTRWGFDPPRESLRLLALAREALQRLGEREPARHVIVVREGGREELAAWGARDTVVFSRKPFMDADLARAREAAAQGGMEVVYLPGGGMDNEFAQLLQTRDPARFFREYRYDVSPVGDDRPFFFYTVQPRDVLRFLAQETAGSADYKINRAVPMLLTVVGVSVMATAIVLVLPPIVLGSRLPRERRVAGFLWYFVFIGAGYILVQVALIQKFVLFLGHPTYALTVIIFSMLVSSGLGSYFSRRTIGQDRRQWKSVLIAIAVLVGLIAFTAPLITTYGIAWPRAVKFAMAALLIAPAGFAMGMPFPTGLSWLEAFHAPSVRWAWSLNAASSVLGSAAATFLAIYIGLRGTLLIGGLLYVCALFTVRLAEANMVKNST